jgi:hypothetical protein
MESTGNRKLQGKQRGSCHCGKVTFEVTLADDARGSRCNCSICTKTSVTSAIVKPEAFTLLSPESQLSSYVWGAEISRRFFCSGCGIHCFGKGHLEQVGGDYVAVNVNCLDEVEPTQVNVMYWDGRHDGWEKGPRDVPWPAFG